MKKISIYVLSLFICLLYIMPISFATDKNNLVPIENNPKLMMDKANLLSDSQEQEILDKLEYIKDIHQCEVLILTVNSLNNLDVLDYADLYYSNNNYGYGNEKTGIMLIISDEERDYAIYVRGKAIDVFSDKRQIYIEDSILEYLKNDDYYGAFNEFASLSEYFLNQGIETYDKQDYPKKPLSPIAYPFAIIIGFVISLFSANFVKKSLKSVRYSTGANNYMVQGSMKLRNSTDRFLYRNITRVPRPKQTSSSSSSGSTRRTGSSGNSFSGRKGKY